jgi:ribulose-5-phosphate 4-epimerase/fuculose-1-phosphate aldolase
MHEALKKSLVQAHRIAHLEGLAEDTIRGHITLRSDDDRVYIKPWPLGFEEVTAKDLLCVDLDGNLLGKKGRLHQELALHLGIYRSRKDIVSVVHVHPFYSVILSSVFTGRLHVIGQNGMHFGSALPFYEGTDLIRTREQGEALAQCLGESRVVLMKNHGIVATGRWLEEAVILAIDFEKAAREHLLASVFGRPTEVPPEVVEAMIPRLFSIDQYRMMWDFYVRKLERRKPMEVTKVPKVN